MRRLIYIRQDKNQELKDPTMVYVPDVEKTLADVKKKLYDKWKITPKVEEIIDGYCISWPFYQLKGKK